MFDPAATLAAAVLTIETSAVAAVTVVLAVELLSSRLMSADKSVTVAVLETGPTELGLVTTSVIVAELGEAMLPREQVTVLVPEQDPTVGVADTNVVPAGRMSVAVTPDAVVRPAAFATVRVYVMLEFAATVAGPVLVMETSTWPYRQTLNVTYRKRGMSFFTGAPSYPVCCPEGKPIHRAFRSCSNRKSDISIEISRFSTSIASNYFRSLIFCGFFLPPRQARLRNAAFARPNPKPRDTVLGVRPPAASSQGSAVGFPAPGPRRP
jgi:hypothetical protein